MPTDPADYINHQVESFPRDQDRNKIAPLFGAIVSAGEIVGYLPLEVSDNGDGTARLAVETLVTLTNPDLDIGDIHLLNTSDAKIDPSTEQKQDDIITELQSIAAIDFATETTLDSLRTAAQNIDSRFESLISSANSTATPLGAGATFTGTGEDVRNASVVAILVFADQESATDGFKVEWSSDGTNWDDDDSFTIPANNGKFYTFAPEARYMRVVYTNGATPQGAFRLQTILKSVYVKPSSHRVGETVSDEDDAELVKAVVTGDSPLNGFTNVKVLSDGTLATDTFERERLNSGKLFAATFTRNSTGSPEDAAFFIAGTAPVLITDIQVDHNASGNHDWVIFLNPTASANGTAKTTLNLNRTSLEASDSVLYDTPTITADGTFLLGFITTGSGGRGQTFRSDLVLAAGDRLLIRRVNGGGGNTLNIRLKWARIDN